MQAGKPPNEEARLAALARYQILDTPVAEEFEDVTRLIARFCGAPVAVINLIDRDRQWFLSEIGLGVRETPLDISICAHAILQPDLFEIPDTLEDPRFAHNPLVTGDPHLRFYAGALLETADGHALGTLCVLDYAPRRLTDDQRELLRVLARQVMKQIELRWILNEQEAARAMLDAAYAHEKRIAETLQRSLLLDIPHQTFEGMDVAPFYEAAWSEAEIGGDFYDAFPLPDGRVALVVGDVAGKGLGAAARTAEVKYALRAFLGETPEAGRALERLNHFLCQFHDYANEDSPRFVAAALCLLDPDTGRLECSLAASESPCLLHPDGTFTAISGGGLPLGVMPGADYPTVEASLHPDDCLLVATDGLTETRQNGEFLGIEGLMSLAAQAATPDLRAFGTGLIDRVKEFSDAALHDDVCLLLARRAVR